MGDAEVHHWDASAGRWIGPLTATDLARATTDLTPARIERHGAKRRLFPSTLWESGRRASGALGAHLLTVRSPGADDAVLVHTSYLAPAMPAIRRAGWRLLADVYDLVWRAHRNDSTGAAPPAAMIRRAYAALVHPRETRGLTAAERIAVAGYEDAELLRAEGLPARWLPTPVQLDRQRVQPPRDDGAVRVGLLGNFAHEATRGSAARLLATPLAASPEVRIVLAGLGSERRLDPARRVEILGPVERVEDFYSRVDCVVVPVRGGSGITCKVTEAVLAGRLAVTNAAGAAGLSPALRRHLVVMPLETVGLKTIRTALSEHDAEAAADEFAATLGWERGVAAYEELLRR